MSNLYSIGQLSKLSNVSTDTLRYYDKIGLLRPEQIDSSSSYRYYSHSQLIKLDIIKVCRSFKLPLETIAELFQAKDAEIFEKSLLTQQKILREKIESLKNSEATLLQLISKLQVFEEVKQQTGFYTRTLEVRSIAVSAQHVDETKDSLDNAHVFIHLTQELRSKKIPSKYEGGFHIEMDCNELKCISAFEVIPNRYLDKVTNIVTLPAGPYLCMRYEASYKIEAFKTFFEEIKKRQLAPPFILDVYLVNGKFSTTDRQFELQCPLP